MSSKQVDLDVRTTCSVAVVVVAFSDARDWVPCDVWSFPEGSRRETDSLEVSFFDLFFPAYEWICFVNRLKKMKFVNFKISYRKSLSNFLACFFDSPAVDVRRVWSCSWWGIWNSGWRSLESVDLFDWNVQLLGYDLDHFCIETLAHFDSSVRD